MAANTMKLDGDVKGPFCFLDGDRRTLTTGQSLLTGTLGTIPVKKGNKYSWQVKVSVTPNPNILQNRSLCELGLTTRKAFEYHRGKEGWLSLTRDCDDQSPEFDHFTILLGSDVSNEIYASVFQKLRNISATKVMTHQGGKLTCTLAFEVDQDRERLNIDILVGDNGDRRQWVVKIDTTEALGIDKPEALDLWPVFLVGHDNGAIVSLTLLNSSVHA